MVKTRPSPPFSLGSQAGRLSTANAGIVGSIPTPGSMVKTMKIKLKQPKHRSGSAEAAQHRKGGPHGKSGYQRHPKHKKDLVKDT